MLKTCKSSGVCWKLASDKPSGGRVSNAWATCLIHRDTNWKRLLIPNMTTASHDAGVKGFTGMRWARVWLACWWGNGLPRRWSVADLRGWSATLGLRTAQTPTGGSSREYWAMEETLTQQYRVKDEGFRIVNFCYKGRIKWRYFISKPRQTMCQQPRWYIGGKRCPEWLGVKGV